MANTDCIMKTVLVFAFLFVLQCAKAPEGAIISQVRGTASVEIQGKSEPATVGKKVNAGDVIITEKDSEVDLQIAGGGAFRVLNASRITVGALAQKSEINVQKGGLLLGLKKMKADEEFTVRSPTALAGVRGTSFSFSADRNTIAVLTGSVQVERQGKALQLEPFQEIQTDKEKLESKKLSPDSARQLARIGEMKGIEDLADFDEIQKNLSVVILEIEKENLKTGKTVAPRPKPEVQ